MGTQTSLAGQPQAKLAMHDSIEWQVVADLLSAQDYQQAAALLQRALAVAETKNDPVATAVLTAAYQLCLSYRQFRAEIDWRQRAYEDALAQEKALQERLSALIDFGAGHVSPQSLAVTDVGLERSALERRPEPTERSLWRRMQYLLSHKAEAALMGSSAYIHPTAKAEDDSLPSLVVHCFGAFRVYLGGELVNNWKGNKSKSVLKYLLFHPEPVHSEILMNAFWRDTAVEAARRNLYQAIYVLRQALPTNNADTPLILCEGGAYRLNPETAVWIDCHAFRQYYEQGRQFAEANRLDEALREYEAANSLYEGDFIPEDPYEEWLLTLREDFRYMYLEVINWLSKVYFDRKQYGTAVDYARKIIQIDNCREDAHRRLMRAYRTLGQRHLARRQYRRCAAALKRELNVSPMAATTDLFKSL